APVARVALQWLIQVPTRLGVDCTSNAPGREVCREPGERGDGEGRLIERSVGTDAWSSRGFATRAQEKKMIWAPGLFSPAIVVDGSSQHCANGCSTVLRRSSTSTHD